MSLLSLCRAAVDQLASMAQPSTIVGSTDPTAQLLLRLANEEGTSLMRRYPWQALTAEHVFTTTAADAQPDSIPADFDRMISETMFNRTRNCFVAGPMSASEWQRIKSTLFSTVNPVYRMRGNAILFAPQHIAGETVAYEYVSKNWCASASGAPQPGWLSDSDTSRLDEVLMTLGLVWRFRQVKGLSYAEDLRLYESRVRDAEARDGGRARLTTDHACDERLPTRLQIPDTLGIS